MARCNALPIRIHAGDFYGCGDFTQQCECGGVAGKGGLGVNGSVWVVGCEGWGW